MSSQIKAFINGVHPILYTDALLREFILRTHMGLDEDDELFEEVCDTFELQVYSAMVGLHLIELALTGNLSLLNVGGIAQEESGQERRSVSDAHWLTADGTTVLARTSTSPYSTGSIRLAFYWHDLDLRVPLIGSWGELTLPEPTPLPARLHALMPYKPSI